VHSGGHPPIHRNQFRFHGGRFMCGQVNALIALTDIGPGDGGTMLIPGSHKSNFLHPDFAEHRMKPEGATVEGIEGAIEVHMQAGDAILFVDGLSHGSARRANEGERRICVFRYGPSWGNFRLGYAPSAELLARLTPERRKIVQPLELLPRHPQVEG
jgi:ectoine hydroxylase-related dioxygenase (phytanoyl-CoA dioxygenase family)